MSDVIRDKTNAEVVAELRSFASHERNAAYVRHLCETAAFRIEACQTNLERVRRTSHEALAQAERELAELRAATPRPDPGERAR